MSIQFSRRHLLSATPAVGITAMMIGAEPVLAAPRSALPALFQAWGKLRMAMAAETDEAKADLIYLEMSQIEDRIIATPCATLQDMAMKIVVSFRDQDMESHPVWVEADMITSA